MSRPHNKPTSDSLPQTASMNKPPHRWEEIWAAGLEPGQLFDAKRSSPSLIKVLDSRGTCSAQKPLKALVPGCGRGYDVVEMALRGYDVLGTGPTSLPHFPPSPSVLLSHYLCVGLLSQTVGRHSQQLATRGSQPASLPLPLFLTLTKISHVF